jgi:hypothetical protein
MYSVTILPPEVWNMVIEPVLEDSVGPHEICDSSNLSKLRQYPPRFSKRSKSLLEVHLTSS